MGVTVYPCPICNREVNRRGNPLSDPSKTQAHITGAHDEPHRDENGSEWAEQIEDGAVEREPDELPEVSGRRRSTMDAAAELVEDGETIDGERVMVETDQHGSRSVVQVAVTSEAAFELAEGASESVTGLQEQLEELREEVAATCPETGEYLMTQGEAAFVTMQDGGLDCPYCGKRHVYVPDAPGHYGD